MIHAYPLAAVIGYPVAHSRSPRIHRYWLKQNNISGDYTALTVHPDDLAGVMKAMPNMGFCGANITIPHKVSVLALADEISETATRIGAANTIVFQDDGKIYADNTDGYGFIANLKANAPLWKPETGPAIVLGAGGAARAVVVGLLKDGVPEIILANRTKSKAEQFKSEFGAKIKVVEWQDVHKYFSIANLIVNTTSLGMVGQPELNLNFGSLKPETTVTDLVYAPLQTNMLRVADEIGCVTVDGLGMLLHQAVPGFEKWFGLRPVVTDDLRKEVLK